jgi:protein SCO1/2
LKNTEPPRRQGREENKEMNMNKLLIASLANLLFLGTLVVLAVDSPSSLAVIGQAPAIRLTDAEGKSFDLESLKGKCVLVSFVFTTCNGTCPLTTKAMAECRDELTKAGLWGEKVEFVSITLDPAHDTPEVLKAYSSSYEADPRSWHFLTGKTRSVRYFISEWGMWVKRDAQGVLDHPSRIFLIDPKGRQREIYSLDFLQPKTVMADVKGLIAEAENR